MRDADVLLSRVDRLGAKVAWIELQARRWKCIVTGIEMPPHQGIGTTPLRALSEVLIMAGRLGWPT